jgi:uncharacterized protein DUF742
VDAGHPTDFGGDGAGVGSPGGHRRRNALADQEWTTFRERVDREWRSRRARVAEEEHLTPPVERPGSGPATYQLTDFGDRLLSGPAAELFGDTSGPATASGDGDFTAFPPASPEPAGPPSMPSLPSHPSIPPVPAQVPPPVPAETSGLVRPYFRTGGRTRPSRDLAIEALVSTSERGRAIGRVRVPEHRSICSLCLDTRSVAEVAAYLRLPLGVVRVLIGDVAGLGLVLVHSATSVVGDRPSIEFMERVLSGLRRI